MSPLSLAENLVPDLPLTLLCSSFLSSPAPPHLYLSSALYLSLNLPTPSISLSCCVTHRWTAQPLCILSVAISARLRPLLPFLQSETPCDTLHERAQSLLLSLFSSQATYARNQSQREGRMGAILDCTPSKQNQVRRCEEGNWLLQPHISFYFILLLFFHYIPFRIMGGCQSPQLSTCPYETTWGFNVLLKATWAVL